MHWHRQNTCTHTCTQTGAQVQHMRMILHTYIIGISCTYICMTPAHYCTCTSLTCIGTGSRHMHNTCALICIHKCTRTGAQVQHMRMHAYMHWHRQNTCTHACMQTDAQVQLMRMHTCMHWYRQNTCTHACMHRYNTCACSCTSTLHIHPTPTSTSRYSTCACSCTHTCISTGSTHVHSLAHIQAHLLAQT